MCILAENWSDLTRRVAVADRRCSGLLHFAAPAASLVQTLAQL